VRLILCRQAKSGVLRRIRQQNDRGRVSRKQRSCATKEQLRGYFEVRFRTKKYAVSYFSGRKRSKAKRPTEKRSQVQERVPAVEDLNGGTPSFSRGRHPLNQSLKFSTSLSDICWVLTIFELPSASNFNVKRKLASELRDPLPTQTE
jgi:hypothetical protein